MNRSTFYRMLRRAARTGRYSPVRQGVSELRFRRISDGAILCPVQVVCEERGHNGFSEDDWDRMTTTLGMDREDVWAIMTAADCDPILRGEATTWKALERTLDIAGQSSGAHPG